MGRASLPSLPSVQGDPREAAPRATSEHAVSHIRTDSSQATRERADWLESGARYCGARLPARRPDAPDRSSRPSAFGLVGIRPNAAGHTAPTDRNLANGGTFGCMRRRRDRSMPVSPPPLWAAGAIARKVRNSMEPPMVDRPGDRRVGNLSFATGQTEASAACARSISAAPTGRRLAIISTNTSKR